MPLKSHGHTELPGGFFILHLFPPTVQPHRTRKHLQPGHHAHHRRGRGHLWHNLCEIQLARAKGKWIRLLAMRCSPQRIFIVLKPTGCSQISALCRFNLIITYGFSALGFFVHQNTAMAFLFLKMKHSQRGEETRKDVFSVFSQPSSPAATSYVPVFPQFLPEPLCPPRGGRGTCCPPPPLQHCFPPCQSRFSIQWLFSRLTFIYLVNLCVRVSIMNINTFGAFWVS